jgi:ABC-type sugar transport system substrate-binding protein
MGDSSFDRPISRRGIVKGALAGAGAMALTPLASAYAAAYGGPAHRLSGRTSQADTSDQSYVTVGFILGIDYWKGPRAGLDQAAKLFNVKTSLVGPDTADQAAQNDIINQVIQTKPSGMIVLPLDPAGVDTAVQAAMEAGIPTMTCLNGYNETGHQIGYVGFDRASAGAMGADLIASQVSGAGTVAALVFDASVPAMQAGLAGFQDRLKQLNPDLGVVVGVDQADPEVGTTVCGQLIQAHPDLKAFMSIDTSGGPSAARALAEAGRTDVTVIAGGMGDYSTEVWPLIQSGQVFAAICEPSSLDFIQQVNYLYNLNQQVSGFDWYTNPTIRVVPQYTNMGSFVVDKSNVQVMIDHSAS